MKNFLMAFLLLPFVLSGATITDGLIAWYKFDGDATDSSGNGNHGVVKGATPTMDRAGAANSAYAFGVGNCVEVSDSTSLQSPDAELTVASWVICNDADQGAIVCKGSNRYAVRLCKKSDGSPCVEVGNYMYGDLSDFPTPGEWTHIAVTVDSSNYVCYMNGVEIGRFARNGYSIKGTGALIIGRNDPGAVEWLDGAIDDLRIYNRALSATEVRELCESDGENPVVSEDFCSEWTSAGTIDLSTGERRVSKAQAVSYGSTWFENGAKAVVKVDVAKIAEKTGTGFVSWSGTEKKRYTLTHQVFNAGGVQVGDTYTATFQWVNQISVVFMGNLAGVDDQTKTYDEGSAYGMLPEVSSPGYEFLGWWTSASGGQQVSTNDIVLAATTLYAHWRSTYIACTPKVEMTPVVVTAPSGASVKVSGLPSGLKFTAKALTVKATRTSPEKKYAANTIYGTPSRSGVYAATVTTTVGTGKSAVSTSTIKKFVVRTDSESMIDAEWDPSEGKVTGMAVGSVGKKVTLKAVANRGFVFAGWYCDSDFTLPMSGTADYRSTSQTLQIEKDDVTYYARFVPASEDGILVARINDEYSVNGPWTLQLDIESLSLPTVTVKGLPTGLKFGAKTLTISGTPTKPGSYTVTLSLKNTTVKKAVTQTFKINVANIESPYLTGISYATDAYNYRGGVAVSWDVGSCATDGYAVSSVSGLPAGLKFNVKTGKTEGVPTKAGTFTATITLKNGKMSSIATVTLNVQTIDTWAYGTFNGGSDDGQVQLTITSAGKLSGKYLSDGLTYALASSSFSYYANGVYQADVKASWSYKDGRNTVKKTDVWPLTVEAGAVGGRATNDVFSAWQNVWSQKDWKAFGTSYFGSSGMTQTLVGSDYGLAEGESIVMKVKSNGSVTLKGVFATGAVKNGKTVYYTATGSAVVCAQSSDPFAGEVFIYFPPNATKKFNGYVRVVSIGE